MGEIARTQRSISIVRKAVLPLFLTSGAAGLIYEVTWTRAFGAVFGNTIFAVSTVLTAFMLGLALGSWLLGRVADRSSRPLMLYASLELMIGVYAFALPVILGGTDLFYRWFFRAFEPGFYPLSLMRFFLSVLILIIPTALMGGTLPVLSKLWSDSPADKSDKSLIGRNVGSLYAINTFGAVAGSFLAGYFLIELFGVRNTIFLAASANVTVGLIALILHAFATRREPDSISVSRRRRGKKRKVAVPKTATAVPDDRDNKRLVVLIAVAIAGFCSLSLQVLWTRVLVFVLDTSTYAFACMLTCFIFGLALGSLLCSRLLVARIKRPVLALGVIEFLVGLSALASVPLLGVLGQIDYALTRRGPMFGFSKEAAIHFLDASVVLLVPTVLMGMVFPIAVSVCARSWKTAGKRIGNLYACNTVGCVFGSFVAGFIIVPLLGLRDSFLAVIAMQLLLAVGILFFSESRRVMAGISAAVVTGVLIIGSASSLGRDVFLMTINTYHHPSEVIYIRDDATGTVTVHDLPDGDRLIAVDGVDVAGADLMLRTTQKLQAYAPLLVHGNPKKVLQIGFGSGETSGVGMAFGVEQYSIVEICPGVFEAGRFFEQINRGSYKDPRLRKIIMDGKNFVKLTNEKFDIIMNDSTYPGTTGSSALYTYDHFRQCRDRLDPEDRDVQSCLNEMKAEIATLAEAVQRTPAEASLRSRLAKRYLLLRDYERAAEHYESFIELEPGNAAGWNNLGICYNRSERFDRAIWAFERAIEHNPRQVHAYVNLAGVHEKRGDWVIASEKLKKAALISHPSEKALMYDKLARSYFMQNKHNLPLEMLEKAIEFASNDPKLRSYLQSRRDSVASIAAGM